MNNRSLATCAALLLAGTAFSIQQLVGTRVATATDLQGPESQTRRRAQQRTSEARVERRTIAGLVTAVWRPVSSGDAPLIVFSHGYGGCGTQSRFLTEALARAGYLVVAPSHADARCGGARGGASRPEVPFGNVAGWSDETYRDRQKNIADLIAALHVGQLEGARIDWKRVGMVGHSLGGYTSLGVGGGWPSWKLPEFKAVLALSPYCHPLALHGSLGTLGVPVMYQGGTRDIGVTPFVQRPGGCFDQTASPAYFVELQNAGHFAWTDLLDDHHALIIAYATAFLDKYVKGDAAARPDEKREGVVALRAK